MLIELRIQNFAIIDKLELRLGAGLITFTGETGAGKSIIVDAVETLVGGRAETSMVRSGAEYAYVEGVFALNGAIREPVHKILEREALLEDPDQVVMAREIRSNGRSVARLNGRNVSAALLRAVGEYLIDVHGQSEHLSLLRASQHIHLLDSYSGIDPLLNPYRASYQKLLEVRRELDMLRKSERDAARRLDTLNFQVNEIEAASLKPDEETTLKEERNRLANAEGIAGLIQQSLTALDDALPESLATSELIGQVLQAMHHLVRLDPSQQALLEQSQALSDQVEDLARDLRVYLETIEFNPRRLDQVEERLGLIQNLKRKYGDTIEAVLAFAARARQEIDGITHASERIEALAVLEKELTIQAAKQALVISQKRRSEAEKLALEIEAELRDLQMNGTQFKVDFERRPDLDGLPINESERVAFDQNGIERIEFQIAPNLGEGFKPLVKIASGGETSRLMLALKHVLASADQIPTLIFDEIDQGIGGRVGSIVGMKLWALARRHQVFCITHLPQLAAHGNLHFHVEKHTHAQRTTTEVRLLEGEQRIQELALMLGSRGQAALQSAREIFAMAKEFQSGAVSVEQHKHA
jgi:DNA repair protein RecN (Recombination protein N)